MERNHRVALADLEHKAAEPRRQQAHHVDGDHIEHNRKDGLQNHAKNIHRGWLLRSIRLDHVRVASIH